ncbi:MAG: hypothetical protein ACLPND_09160, partial [Candidatus Korobacteraceae bacterium]
SGSPDQAVPGDVFDYLLDFSFRHGDINDEAFAICDFFFVPRRERSGGCQQEEQEGYQSGRDRAKPHKYKPIVSSGTVMRTLTLHGPQNQPAPSKTHPPSHLASGSSTESRTRDTNLSTLPSDGASQLTWF